MVLRLYFKTSNIHKTKYSCLENPMDGEKSQTDVIHISQMTVSKWSFFWNYIYPENNVVSSKSYWNSEVFQNETINLGRSQLDLLWQYSVKNISMSPLFLSVPELSLLAEAKMQRAKYRKDKNLLPFFKK